MPREITLQNARKITEEVWPIKEILEIVSKDIKAREISDDVESNERKQEKTARDNTIFRCKTKQRHPVLLLWEKSSFFEL